MNLDGLVEAMELGFCVLAAAGLYLFFLRATSMGQAAARWLVAGYVIMCIGLLWRSDWGAHLNFNTVFFPVWFMSGWLYCVLIWFRPRGKKQP